MSDEIGENRGNSIGGNGEDPKGDSITSGQVEKIYAIREEPSSTDPTKINRQTPVHGSEDKLVKTTGDGSHSKNIALREFKEEIADELPGGKIS